MTVKGINLDGRPSAVLDGLESLLHHGPVLLPRNLVLDNNDANGNPG